MRAIKRDNHRCVKCGSNGYYFHWNGDKKEDQNGFVVDHIHPIALGGDEWDLNNLQTLCPACNKIKTKEDAANIAEARRIEKKLVNGQKQLA